MSSNIYDLMEFTSNLDLDLELRRKNNVFLLALHSTRHEGKTFPRNHKSQPDGSLGKWQESFLTPTREF